MRIHSASGTTAVDASSTHESGSVVQRWHALKPTRATIAKKRASKKKEKANTGDRASMTAEAIAETRSHGKVIAVSDNAEDG